MNKLIGLFGLTAFALITQLVSAEASDDSWQASRCRGQSEVFSTAEEPAQFYISRWSTFIELDRNQQVEQCLGELRVMIMSQVSDDNGEVEVSDHGFVEYRLGSDTDHHPRCFYRVNKGTKMSDELMLYSGKSSNYIGVGFSPERLKRIYKQVESQVHIQCEIS